MSIERLGLSRFSAREPKSRASAKFRHMDINRSDKIWTCTLFIKQLVLNQSRIPNSDTLRKCTRRDLNSHEISPARFKHAAYSLFRHWCKFNFSFLLLAGNLIVSSIFTSFFLIFLTANTGIEPMFLESESNVLPLHQSARSQKPTAGLEPATYWLRISCATNCAMPALRWR